MKKLVAIIVCCIAFGGLLFFMFQLQQKPEIRTTLSARSQEYLKDRNQNSATSLKNIAIADPNATDTPQSQDITVGDCFTIHLPFQIRSLEQKKPCYAYVATDRPRGRVTVYQEASLIESAEQVPGLSMRRLKTDLYKEVDKTYHNQTFYIFKRLDETYEKTVFTYSPNSYFILTLQASGTEEDVDKKLFQMLESVAFQKK